MQIWRGLGEIPPDLSCVVTLGNFDGVHKGHREVIDRCVQVANQLQVPAVAITFDPHPLVVHRPDTAPELITPLERRLAALESTGLDAVAVLEYVPALYALTAEEFIRQILVGKFHLQAIVVGEDARFGAGNSGNVEFLSSRGRLHNFAVEVVADCVGTSGRRWSSTWARELLNSGDVAQAAQVLGGYHSIHGIVQHGHKRGRELGFPTANLHEDSAGIIPADGVYAGWLTVDGASEKLPAAISVGTNPQFAGVKRTVEAHVLGRSDLNLYGLAVTVEFVERLREMGKFASLEALLLQMDDDLLEAARILGVAPATRVDPAAVTAGV